MTEPHFRSYATYHVKSSVDDAKISLYKVQCYIFLEEAILQIQMKQITNYRPGMSNTLHV